mgnify:CR=1 FL=1
MTNKNLHEDSSCPVEQDVLEESTEGIMDEGDQNSENGFSEFNFSEEHVSYTHLKAHETD